jgi:hypothetical protein
MEIFTNEFKNLLSTQLEELADVVKTKRSNEMSDYEIAKAMEDCMNNADCGKKEKKKKNKKFKVGDVVYYGKLEGIVEERTKYSSFYTIYVIFKISGDEIEFTEDGRYSPKLPIVLSHFPYELKMKKIK